MTQNGPRGIQGCHGRESAKEFSDALRHHKLIAEIGGRHGVRTALMRRIEWPSAEIHRERGADSKQQSGRRNIKRGLFQRFDEKLKIAFWLAYGRKLIFASSGKRHCISGLRDHSLLSKPRDLCPCAKQSRAAA